MTENTRNGDNVRRQCYAQLIQRKAAQQECLPDGEMLAVVGVVIARGVDLEAVRKADYRF